ncbi:MAG: hypothetical protein H0W88_08860 [Parachlamydiaceae bacterium]|nr:hypothetical protein [Parachlamydiaceae bacterium]
MTLILPENQPPTSPTSSSLRQNSVVVPADTPKSTVTSQIGADKISSLTTPETPDNLTPRKVKIIKKELKLEATIASLKDEILTLKQEMTKLKKEQEPTMGKRLKGLVAWTLRRTETESSDKMIKLSIKSKEMLLAIKESELTKTSEKLAKLQKKLGFDEAEWVKFALKLLKDKPKITMDHKHKNMLLEKLVNIGLKGTLENDLTFHRAYEGVKPYDFALTKVDALRNLIKKSLVSGKPLFGMKTEEERRGLQRLLQNRLNLLEFQKLHSELEFLPTTSYEYIKKVSEISSKIITEINNLEKNIKSEKILLLEDGSKFFAFPGGWKGHYITYGIKKNVDGTFEFLVFNRGERSSNVHYNVFFHGSISYSDKDKFFSKTTTVLKLPLSDLMNKQFISSITEFFHYGSSNDVYECFINLPEVDTVWTDTEYMIHQLNYVTHSLNVSLSQKKRVNEFIRDAIKSDPKTNPQYSSLQQFGTCGDSNLTPIDKLLAPEMTNLVVFQHTLASLVDDVRENYLGPKPKMKTDSYNEAFTLIENYLQKKKFDNSLALLNTLKENIEKRNQEVEKQQKLATPSRTDLEICEKNCLKALDLLNQLAPESITPIIQELSYHIIKSWGHEKPIQILATKKLEQVQKKLEAPAPTKKTPVSTEAIQKMIEETILNDCSEVDENLPIDQYVKPFIAKLEKLDTPLKLEHSPERDITNNAMMNTCPIDIDRIRKKLTSKQNQEIDLLLAEYQQKYELFKESLEKEIPKLDQETHTQKIQKFNEDFVQQDYTIEQPMAFIAIWGFTKIMSKIAFIKKGLDHK